MQPLLSAAAMRSADARTIAEIGIPGFTLMETAGRALAAAALQEVQAVRMASEDPILCVCGTGNNGGDGFVAARVLHEAGHAVRVILVGDENQLTIDSAVHLDVLRRTVASGNDEAAPAEILTTGDRVTASVIDARTCLIIDALLGTGVRGPARPPAAAWIDAINATTVPVVSADVPSGLDATTGRAGGSVIRADRTVTFGALKTGLRFNDGPRLAGRVSLAPIGIPMGILAELTSEPGCARLISRDDVVIPGRGSNAHKYSSGVLGALCGSIGFTGAAAMATAAAMRMGAGAVRCAAGFQASELLAAKLMEVMIVGLDEDTDGLIPDNATDQFLAANRKANAFLVGCGSGRSVGTRTTIREIIRRADVPVVVDADGLFALGSSAGEILKERTHATVLTPHRGEFEKLIGDKSSWDDRIDLAREYSMLWNCVLLLKGLPSVVATPDGRVFVSSSSSAALATAGSGDVLAGMIAGLLSQGVKAVDAVVTSLYVGGLCADRFEETHAPQSMMATDIIGEIGGALRALSRA